MVLGGDIVDAVKLSNIVTSLYYNMPNVSMVQLT